MDHAAIFTSILRRNALRREALLPSLDVRVEYQWAVEQAHLPRGGVPKADHRDDDLRQATEAVSTARVLFAILAMVARLHPVAACIWDHDAPARSIEPIPELRATFSARPL